MAVFRIEKTRDYTVMSNYHLRDMSLSLKAKGLLSLMLSLPENWDYTMKGLARICKDGIDSISGGIRELEAHGYLVRARVRGANGQLGSIEYTILEQPKAPSPTQEKPILENPVQANPMLDAPIQENPAQLNKEESSNYLSKTDLSITGKTAVEIDKEIAAKYEGILTDKKVQQMMSDFAPTSDLHGLSAIYVYQNAMQSAAFSRFSDKEGNWNGLSVSDVFGNEEIKIGYVDGWLSTSRNMVRVFVALALAVIIMLAPIFSGEYEGVDNIILTSKYGKTKCATAKVVAGIITAILTTTLIAAFNLLLAFVFYGTEGLDCSILFAPSDYVEAFIPFNITCGTLLKYQILLAFTCTLSVTGITLFLSAISKNQIVALVAAMAIFLFPVLLPITEVNPLFRLVGLLPIYHVLAISLLSVEQMSNGMLYAIWAIPAALLFWGVGAGISRRVFAKHQVL